MGEIVGHRQLQVATGSAMSMKPRFTGPYTVEELLPDGSSAMIQHMHSGHIMKAHFSNLRTISYHPAGNRVHANFDNDLQESLEKDTEIDTDDEELSQMLSQRSTLLTRTVRHLGGPDWQNDPENETQARFVDSDGEELQNDPSEALLSTQENNGAENRNETEATERDDTEFDQAAFAQFVVRVAELKCNLLELNSIKFYNENGFHKEYHSDEDEENLQSEMAIDPPRNLML